MSNNIPTFPLVITKASFQQWSDEMAEKGLLFHYEDDPSEIEDKHGYNIFTKQ